MIEWIITKAGALAGIDVASLVMFVVAFNMLLSGVGSALNMIKDKTATSLDNKAYDMVNKLSGILLKIIDIIGHNPEHK